MLGVGHHKISGQAVGKGANLARGAAGAGLAGERERAVAGFRNFAHQQVHVVDHVVDPTATAVLVEAHRPAGDHFGLGIGVSLGQGFKLIFGHT